MTRPLGPGLYFTSNNQRTSGEVLQSLRRELLSEKQTLEERIVKINTMLSNNAPLLDEDCFESASFQMITEVLGADQIERYSNTCPEIHDQHRRLSGILDDFQWCDDYREGFRILAEYFKNHPQQYELALESGQRWAEIAHLDEDDPRIEAFARESVALVNSMPPVRTVSHATGDGSASGKSISGKGRRSTDPCSNQVSTAFRLRYCYAPCPTR